MTRIALPSWIIAIALAGYLHLATAQNPAYVPQSVVGAKVGFPTNFTCQSNGIPIQTCLWERDAPASSGGAGSLIINFNPGNARQGESPVKGYSYLGDGLEKGECGITIQTVKEEDNGSWKCTLIASTGLFRGVVDLGILRKPDAPKFNPAILSKLVDSDDSNAFRNSQLQKIVCFSGNGQPPPRFQWFIDEQPITEGLTPINSTIDTGSGVVYTFQELINHRFTWRDNGKKLRCIAVHDALGPNDQKEVTMDIDIQYAPRAAREDDGNSRINVRAEIGAEQILSVNVSANPRPTTVVWNVDNKPIREGENNEKYDAMIIKEVESGIWETNLRIKSVEEEDVNKNFILTVTNDFGEANFNLYVASEATGGLSAGGIVLLILGIAALIIIIALVVVYARAQGLLCFKGDDGTASEKERMDGGSTGGGAVEDQQQQQQKPGLKLTSRLTALYDNLLNKKKDKPAPVDEESATATKEPTQESSSPTKPVLPAGEASSEPPTSDKKPEDIVYAELDLARSGGGNGPNPEIVVRGSDDKTEYAEIVGVVAAGQIDEKKSPSASNKSGGSATEK